MFNNHIGREIFKKMVLALCLLLMIPVSVAQFSEIDIQQMKALMDADAIVIDIRTPGEWKQTGIVEGSIPIMFFNEKRQPLTESWLKQASEYVTPDKQLVLICRTGSRTRLVGNYLVKQQGFQQVYSVDGGIKRWVAEGNKTIPIK